MSARNDRWRMAVGMFRRIPASDVDRAYLEWLGQQTGLKLGELVALGPQHDPFLAGTDVQRERAEWFASIAAEHGIKRGHQRGIWYRLGHSGIEIPLSWRQFGDAMSYARILGLVDPWEFSDKRTRTVLDDRRGDGLAEVVFDKPELHVPGAPRLREGRVHHAGSFWFDPWRHQPARTLVVCEKDDEDLFEEVRPSCDDLGAGLAVTLGNSTWGYAWALTGRAREDGAGRPLVVYWLSDADLSGEDMPSSMARHIEYIRSRHPDVPPIYLNQVALSMQQVGELEVARGIVIPKAPDPRTIKDEHGRKITVERVELNALPIYVPGWIAQELREALEAATAEIEEPVVEGWDEPDADGGKTRKEKVEQAKRIIDRAHARMRDQDGWKIDVAEAVADEVIEDWEPEVPEVDVPELNLDKTKWLLRPRDYAEQLDVYRTRDGRGPLPPLKERVCAKCGKPIGDRDKRAIYCLDCTPKVRKPK